MRRPVLVVAAALAVAAPCALGSTVAGALGSTGPTRTGALASTRTAVAAPAASGGAGIPLPDPSSAASPVDPTALLGPDRPNEVLNRSPGPIDDEETVVVGITADGTVASVTVDQRLTITGVGDFSLKIPGPATDVRAPAGASNQPGLRRGSVIWEGFSGGRKDLEATVELRPDVERLKLPIAVHADGRQIRIQNTTAQPVEVTDGEPLPGAAEDVLARVRAALLAGAPPFPGTAGIPATVPEAPAGSSLSTQTISVAAPFRITGQVDGGQPFDAIVPGPQAPDGVLVVPGSGSVHFTATPSLPDPAGVAPATGRDALRRAEVAIWQAIRLADVDAYLGNPKPGRSSTTFRFEPARAGARTALHPAAADHPRPVAIALTIAATLALVAGAAVAWARN